jgi:hypothetical protein
MEYDYKLLLGKITEVFGTQANFAKALGKSERTISLKLNNKVDWTQDEMIAAAKALQVELTSIPQYFFTLKVQY